MNSLSIVCKQSEYLDFILSGLNQDVEIISIASHESILFRLFHLFLNGRSMTPRRGYYTYISRKTIHRLLSVHSRNILMLGAIDFRMCHVICQCLPKEAKKSIWLWNEVGKGNVELSSWKFSHNDKMGIRTYSYNPADVATYGLRFVPQVYRYVDGLYENVCIKQDCYWVGRPKGRISQLSVIKSELDNFGLKCNFKLIEKSEDVISYSDNLKEICSSKCLLDLYNETNEGISLRVLEALFFKKKLITTNRFVKNYDFYRPQNIFIWGTDDAATLKVFIETDFFQVEKEIVDKYDINNWIRNFE